MKDKTREVSKQEQHLMGLGAVIRDSHGQVIAAAIQNLEFQGDVSVAKAQAVKGWSLKPIV